MIPAMDAAGLASLPAPPYWTVVFTSRLRAEADGYGAMAERMVALASRQPGFLGLETARGADGLGITVSYWRDEPSIAAWKEVVAHRAAQEKGKRDWYAAFELRVARVERAASFRMGAP